MTNAQKWVAAFLALFVILFFLGRITKKDEEMPETQGNYSSQNSQQAGELDGFSLMKQNGCTSCHGQELTGTQMAPALANIKDNWTRDGLINYLRNPSSFGGGKRFDDYRVKYKNIRMPSFGNVDVKDLGKIADFLLTK